MNSPSPSASANEQTENPLSFPSLDSASAEGSASGPNLNYLTSGGDGSSSSTSAAASTSHAGAGFGRHVLRDRLFVGNLHPTVDEFTLLQVFSKFGKITKLDFLFHKTGLLKGKPRGYAFVEYGNEDDALKAMTKAHDKLLRGRKLVVTLAHQAPIDAAGNGPVRPRKGMMETGRPTTLSMLKTGIGSRNDASKIAIMEAKLRQMEKANTVPAAKSNPQSGSLMTTGETPSASKSLPSHPSLPSKPMTQIPVISSKRVLTGVKITKSKPPNVKESVHSDTQ